MDSQATHAHMVVILHHYPWNQNGLLGNVCTHNTESTSVPSRPEWTVLGYACTYTWHWLYSSTRETRLDCWGGVFTQNLKSTSVPMRPEWTLEQRMYTRELTTPAQYPWDETRMDYWATHAHRTSTVRQYPWDKSGLLRNACTQTQLAVALELETIAGTTSRWMERIHHALDIIRTIFGQWWNGPIHQRHSGLWLSREKQWNKLRVALCCRNQINDHGYE